MPTPTLDSSWLARMVAPFRRGGSARLAEAKVGPTVSSPMGAWSYGFADGSTPTPADGPLWLNVVVATCLGWLDRNFPVADLEVKEVSGRDDLGDVVADHEFMTLMDRPSPIDTFHSFCASYLLSDVCDGTTVFVKVRDGRDKIHSLWWVPPWDVEIIGNPAKDADRPILWYRCNIDGYQHDYAPEDVVCVKDGKDPANHLRGLSKLKAGLRAVSTIDRAELYTQTLMRNCGAIPAMLSPSSPGEVISPDNIASLRGQFSENQLNYNSGKPFVSTQGLRLDKIGITPEEMSLDKIREFPAAAICALIGTPAMAVGLPDPGKTYSNLQQAEYMAWRNGIIPRQERFAEAIDKQCPELVDPFRERVVWNRSKIAVLNTPLLERLDGLSKAAGGPILTPDEARQFLDLGATPGGETLRSPAPAGGMPAPIAKPVEPAAEDDPPPAAKSLGSEREDGIDPFPAERKDDMPPRVGPGEDDPRNPFDLPTGEPIREELIKWFNKQMADVIGTIPPDMAELPDAFPPLADYDDPMSAAMTPIVSAYWQESGANEFGRIEAATGLDLGEWSVVNPHTRRKIETAAFDFCKATNETTTLELNTALDRLRAELIEGMTERGEGLRELTKRVKSVFEHASTYRAERIAKSESSRAVHAAQAEAAAESDVVQGLEWLLSTDACPLCQEVGEKVKQVKLGDKFAVIGNHPTYQDIYHPPLHASCQCSITHVLIDEFDGPTNPVWGEPLVKPGKEPKDGG